MMVLLQTNSGLKNKSQGVTAWCPQSCGMSRKHRWGKVPLLRKKLTVQPHHSALIRMLMSVLLNSRVKVSFPAPERNGLGQLVSFPINFLILQK